MATEQAQRDRQIAQVIREQLGSHRFSLMVGASDYLCGNDEGNSYLQFRFKMFPKANIYELNYLGVVWRSPR